MALKLTVLLAEESVFGGWSESWYHADSDSITMTPKVVALCNLRMGLASPNVSFQSARLSIIGSPRQYSNFYPSTDYGGITIGQRGVLTNSQIDPTGVPSISGAISAWSNQATELDTAVIVDIAAQGAHHRRFMLRGCPEGILDSRNNYRFRNSNWRGALLRFFNALVGDSWQLRVADVNQVPTPVLSVTVLGGGHAITFQTNGPIVRTGAGNVVGGDFVQLRAIRGGLNITGTWKLLTTLAPTAPSTAWTYTTYSKLTLAAAPPGDISQAANARYVLPDTAAGKYANIIGWIDERVATRKTGRPSVLPRGRRRRTS